MGNCCGVAMPSQEFITLSYPQALLDDDMTEEYHKSKSVPKSIQSRQITHFETTSLLEDTPCSEIAIPIEEEPQILNLAVKRTLQQLPPFVYDAQ